MEWIKFDIHTTTAEADAFGEILAQLGIFGYEIKDHVPLTEKEEKQMYTDIPANPEPDDGSSILTFYLDTDNNEEEFYSTGSSLRDARLEEEEVHWEPEALKERIIEEVKNRQQYIPLTIPKMEYCVQDDSMWKDKWKENFKPFHVADDIIIKPSWEEIPEDAKETDIIIEIDPGSAFGTGTHETTKLCLLSLRKYINSETTILDAGCGSGILAIAALLCGAKSAFCLDIDPYAVEGTRENAQKNHISEEALSVMHANILEDSEAVRKECKQRFQIVVANILADVIVLLAAHVQDFLLPDGLFISSGILAEKADDVENALLENGFRIIEKNTMGEWVSFVAALADK